MKILTLASFALLLTGCAKADTADDTTSATSATATADPAVKAANVANAIAATPTAADSILKANDYTRDSYDKLLLDIAADSAMSARYAAARAR